jgi:hypothetical protein
MVGQCDTCLFEVILLKLQTSKKKRLRGRSVHPLLKAYELFCSTSNGDVTSCLSSPMRLEDAGVGARYFYYVECLFIHNDEVEVHVF